MAGLEGGWRRRTEAEGSWRCEEVRRRSEAMLRGGCGQEVRPRVNKGTGMVAPIESVWNPEASQVARWAKKRRVEGHEIADEGVVEVGEGKAGPRVELRLAGSAVVMSEDACGAAVRPEGGDQRGIRPRRCGPGAARSKPEVSLEVRWRGAPGGWRQRFLRQRGPR